MLLLNAIAQQDASAISFSNVKLSTLMLGNLYNPTTTILAIEDSMATGNATVATAVASANKVAVSIPIYFGLDIGCKAESLSGNKGETQYCKLDEQDIAYLYVSLFVVVVVVVDCFD